MKKIGAVALTALLAGSAWSPYVVQANEDMIQHGKRRSGRILPITLERPVLSRILKTRKMNVWLLWKMMKG